MANHYCTSCDYFYTSLVTIAIVLKKKNSSLNVPIKALKMFLKSYIAKEGSVRLVYIIGVPIYVLEKYSWISVIRTLKGKAVSGFRVIRFEMT